MLHIRQALYLKILILTVIVAWGAVGLPKLTAGPLNPCNMLISDHTGEGEDPTVIPANSNGCPEGEYVSGEFLNLLAAPSSAWTVKNWSGTLDNDSPSTTNTAVMPSGLHTVIVNYEFVPAEPNEIYIPVFLGEQTSVVEPPQCYTGPGELEMNNSIVDANGPLCNSGVYWGFPNDQNDFFSFDTSTGTIAIELTGHEGDGIQVILYRGATEVSKDYGNKDVFQVQYPATPGRYHIRIFAETPRPESTQWYNLEVSFP